MINLYYSFIYPYILYALICWYAAPAYLTNRVAKLQKKSIRFIHNLPYNSHTGEFFLSSNIIPLEQLYKTNVLVYLFKTINGNYDDDLMAMLRMNSDFHSFATRHRENFVLPKCEKSGTQQSVFYKGVKLWNALPEDVKKLKSLSSFKKCIRLL